MDSVTRASCRRTSTDNDGLDDVGSHAGDTTTSLLHGLRALEGNSWGELCSVVLLADAPLIALAPLQAVLCIDVDVGEKAGRMSAENRETANRDRPNARNATHLEKRVDLARGHAEPAADDELRLRLRLLLVGLLLDKTGQVIVVLLGQTVETRERGTFRDRPILIRPCIGSGCSRPLRRRRTLGRRDGARTQTRDECWPRGSRLLLYRFNER